MKPYAKAQTIRLPENLDRRIRLTEKQKSEIRKLYATGKYGHRPLARMFGVSRSLIRLVVDPERADKVRERSKEHWRDYAKKYGKEYHARMARNVKNYKYRLFKAGKLKENYASEKD